MADTVGPTSVDVGVDESVAVDEPVADDRVTVDEPVMADDPVAAGIAAAVRAKRLAAGLSMRALAAKAGMSQPFLSNLENGRAMPSITTLYKIAAALGVSARDFLADEADSVALVRAGSGPLSPVGDEPTSARSRLVSGGPGRTHRGPRLRGRPGRDAGRLVRARRRGPHRRPRGPVAGRVRRRPAARARAGGHPLARLDDRPPLVRGRGAGPPPAGERPARSADRASRLSGASFDTAQLSPAQASSAGNSPETPAS